MDETVLQALVDESELRKLMLALPRCLDTRDWEGLGNLFTEDATMNVHGLIRTGRETIVAGPKGDLERLYEATQHIIGNIYVDVNGDEANIVAYCFGAMIPKRSEMARHSDAGGFYTCVARRTAEGWRFSAIDADFLWSAGMDLEVGSE